MISTRTTDSIDTSTIDGMARDFLSRADTSGPDFQAFKSLTASDMHSFHHSVGRQIRNHYGLWHDHSITKDWRENEAERAVIEGVDFSIDHPDAISMAVLLRIHEVAQTL